MMYPILCKVKYETLHLAFRKREIWVQVLFSVFVNWIIAPFLMVRRIRRILKGNSRLILIASSPCRGLFYRTSLVSERVLFWSA